MSTIDKQSGTNSGPKSDTKLPALRLVPSPAEPGPLPSPSASGDSPAERASELLAQAVMHAAMSWVACCRQPSEQEAHHVEVARVGPGLFDALVHLHSGEVQCLRVRLDLRSGPTLTSVVSVLHVE